MDATAPVPTVALVTLIRTSTQSIDPGGVLAADLCALSFCAQRRNVSVSLNQQSSTILQTVYGTKVVHQFKSSDVSNDFIKWLSFIGDNYNMTFPSQVDETHFSDYSEPEWEQNLQSLIGSLMGKMTGTINNTGPPAATSNIIAAFNASSNISLAMDNIATTLTNYFRDSNNATVAGQAGQAETYVPVDWPWITLPAFLVIAGIIFLILAMFESKRQGARIWKTSELALLFHRSRIKS